MQKQRPRPHRRNERDRSVPNKLILLSVGSLLALAGCGSDEEEVVVIERKAPPPPPRVEVPTVTPVSELMTMHNIDPRITMSEQYAPSTDESRIAVLKFFDTMTRGDSSGLGMMLSDVDQGELAELASDGSFEEIAYEIGSIEVRTGITPIGDEAAVAIIQTYDDYQPQLWRLESDGYGGTVFHSAATPMNVMDKLSGDNWITQWYQLLDEELEIALRLDEEIEPPQRDLSKGNNASISGGGSSPSGPGRGRSPGRDRPVVEPPSFDPSAPG